LRGMSLCMGEGGIRIPSSFCKTISLFYLRERKKLSMVFAFAIGKVEGGAGYAIE